MNKVQTLLRELSLLTEEPLAQQIIADFQRVSDGQSEAVSPMIHNLALLARLYPQFECLRGVPYVIMLYVGLGGKLESSESLKRLT